MLDGSILAISLAALLVGVGSIALQRTRDLRVIGEPNFPLRTTRDWNMTLRSAML